MRSHLVLGVLALASAAPHALPAQDFPSAPPAAGAVKPAPFPAFQEATLANGLRLIVVENHRLPVVSLSLSFPAGTAVDPAGKEGLSEMVAGLLTKGAGDRSADAIAAAIEGVGGRFSASSGSDALTVSAGVLTSDLDLAFGLLADAIQRPAFPERELELLRTQTLSALQLELSQPAALADRYFAKAVYGAHPYGRRQSRESVRGITRDDLAAFARERLQPAGAMLVVAGALSLAEARARAEKAFAGWTGTPAATPPFPDPPASNPTEILLIHRPGSVQSNIVAGNVTFPASHPLRYAATMANKVLGGGADARLFLILREAKSWTYGAYSSLSSLRGPGTFEATTEVRTEVTDSALVELLSQLRRIRTEPVSAEELQGAKGALVGSFPLTVETADQIAEAVARAKRLDLPADYLATYRTKLAAVRAAELQSAAQQMIRADHLAIVVVGDAIKILPQLEAIAPVRIVSVEGAPLTRESLFGAGPSAGLAFDPSLIVAGLDSFQIVLQGNPLGTQTRHVSRTGDRITVVEETHLALAGVEQRSELTFDRTGAIQRLDQSGTVQGQPTEVHMTYAGGRAKGNAKTMTAAGPKEIAVDTTVSPNAIDDSSLLTLFPAVAWAPGAQWTFQSFSAGQGTESTQTLRVTGRESVTVPLGTFEAFTAELSGGPIPFTFWVSAEAPHRLLKIALVGQPVEFVRVR